MIFLNPEVKQRQGLLYNTKQIKQDEFQIDVEFAIGNSQNSIFGTNGMGIFLLQEVPEKDISKGSLFGYSNEFIGAAVFLNSGLRRRDPQNNNRVEGIQGIVSHGTRTVSLWEIPPDDTCYTHYREGVDQDKNPIFNTLRMKYNEGTVSVLYFDKENDTFVKCFSLEVDLSSGVYLAFSSSSGIWDQDFHIIRKIKTIDPNKMTLNNHKEEAKKLKGIKYVESIKQATDLIHDNRLKYNDKDDLLRKVNLEISGFLRNTQILEGLVRTEVTQSQRHDADSNFNMDYRKISEDCMNMMRDIQILK